MKFYEAVDTYTGRSFGTFCQKHAPNVKWGEQLTVTSYDCECRVCGAIQINQEIADDNPDFEDRDRDWKIDAYHEDRYNI